MISRDGIIVQCIYWIFVRFRLLFRKLILQKAEARRQVDMEGSGFLPPLFNSFANHPVHCSTVRKYLFDPHANALSEVWWTYARRLHVHDARALRRLLQEDIPHLQKGEPREMGEAEGSIMQTHKNVIDGYVHFTHTGMVVFADFI